MTINSTTTRASYLTDGATTVFACPNQAYLPADYLVLLTNIATGAVQLLVLNSDYTLATTGSQNPSQWNLTTTPVRATGFRLQIILAPLETQPTIYQTGAAFPSSAVQQNVDRLTQMVLRLADQVARCVQVPDGDNAPTTLLPVALLRSNLAVVCDVNGNLVMGAFTGTTVTEALLQTLLTGATLAVGTLRVNGVTIPSDAGIYGPSANTLGFATGGVQWGTLNAGNWVLLAATAGDTLTASGVAAGWAATLIGSATAGSSLGLRVKAGTTAADFSARLQNQAGSQDYLTVQGDGQAYVFAPTAARNAGPAGTFQIGYMGLPVAGTFVANYNSVLADSDQNRVHNNAGAHNFVIKDATVNGGLGYPVGTTLVVEDPAAQGVVTISLETTPANLVLYPTGATGNRTLTAPGYAVLYKYGAGAPGLWRATGPGVT